MQTSQESTQVTATATVSPQETSKTLSFESKDNLSIDITPEQTIDITPAKKNSKKCFHSDSNGVQCSERPVKIVGDCRYCQNKFCSKHRLPEAHFCPNMTTCRENAMSKLSSKLLGEKTVATKI